MLPRFESLFGKWLLATVEGWLLGFVLLVVLAEAWSVTGTEAQFMVGIGMGAGIGFLQARILGAIVDSPRRWLWSSIVGMGIPFVAWDVAAWLGISVPNGLLIVALVGALLVGALQAILLRPLGERAVWWIPASVAGWGLPVVLLTLDNVGLLPLVGILLGGPILGAVTGIALVWISKPRHDLATP